MKFSAVAETRAFLHAVRFVATASGRNSPVAVLNAVRMVANKGRLTLTCTNCDQWARATIEIEEGSGEAIINAARLESILALLPSGGVCSMKADIGAAPSSGTLHLSCARTNHQITMMDPREWPTEQAIGEPCTVSVSPKQFAASLQSLQRATPEQKDSRQYLKGAFLDFAAGVMVATNGYILGRERGPWTIEDGRKPPSVILPVETFAAIRKLLDDAEECALLVAAEGKLVTFDTGDYSFTTKLVSGEYPDYMRILPQQQPNLYSVNKEEFSLTLRRASSVNAGQSRAVEMRFQDSDVTIRSVNPDTGDRAEDACASTVDIGKPISIGASSQYLAWATDTLDTEQLKIQADTASDVFVIFGAEDTDRDHVRAVMPMRF